MNIDRIKFGTSLKILGSSFYRHLKTLSLETEEPENVGVLTNKVELDLGQIQ